MKIEEIKRFQVTPSTKREAWAISDAASMGADNHEGEPVAVELLEIHREIEANRDAIPFLVSPEARAVIGVGLEVLRELVEESVESSDDFAKSEWRFDLNDVRAAAEVFPC